MSLLFERKKMIEATFIEEWFSRIIGRDFKPQQRYTGNMLTVYCFPEHLHSRTGVSEFSLLYNENKSSGQVQKVRMEIVQKTKFHLDLADLFCVGVTVELRS